MKKRINGGFGVGCLGKVLEIAVFLLPLAVGFGYVEYRLYRMPTTFSLKRDLIERSPDAGILVLGSSLGFFDINPEVWPVKGINMADASQSLWYDKEIVKRYVPVMKNLKVVIVPVGTFTPWYDLSVNQYEYFREFLYLRYDGYPPSNLMHLEDVRNISLISLYTPPTVREYIRQGFTEENTQHINRWGAYRLDYTLSYGEGDWNTENYRQRYGLMTEPGFYGKNLAYLKELIDTCREHGVKVVVLRTPESPELSSTLTHQQDLLIGEFMSRYADGKNVLSVSYAHDDRLVHSDFFDVEHLNASGADKFSRDVYEEVIKALF